MTEICVQVYCKLDEIKKIVIEKGFNFSESYTIFDSYFTHIPKENLKKISYNKLLDNSIIVRHIKSDILDIKNLVYKKKTLDENENVIEEIKTKIKIDDIEKTKNVFNNMGLTCWCNYENENNEYKKDEIILNIQYVKELGVFIEIEEFESISMKSIEEKFAILKDIINSLNLPIGTDYSCKKPYMYLFDK